MKVEELFQLLKREFWKINILQACLDSITFFLAGNLVLFLFSLEITSTIDNLPLLVAATVIIFLTDLIYRSQKYNIEIYEEKNPELREILRTAKDNIDTRTTVSQALFDELMERSREVTSESIVPSKRILQKIFLVGALSFLTVLSGLADFQIAEMDEEIVEDLGGIEDILDESKDVEDELDVKNSTEIMGEEKDIDVAENLIDYNITGEGQSPQSDIEGGDTGTEDPILTSSGPAISDDLELAKQYSLATKGLE